VLYKSGFSVRSAHLHGDNTRFGIGMIQMPSPDSVPVDSVAVLESLRQKVDVPLSLLISGVGSAALFAGGAALLISSSSFGSCPTIYSDSAGTPVLEAEAFSYSIASIFESRDVDRLRARPDSTGLLRLEIRNEMLETHYMNGMELLEAAHGSSERIATRAGGGVIALTGLQTPAVIIDRNGRDLRALVEAADEVAFGSDSTRLAEVSLSDMRDHLRIVHPVSAGVDSIAIWLRLRSSLLSTVLFYDVMLATQGAQAIDWLETDLSNIGVALDLGAWVHGNLGLSVQSDGDGPDEMRELARIGDPGPIAWKDVAVVVPVDQADSVRLRLDFVIDGWRIDQIAIAREFRQIEPRRIAPHSFTTSDGSVTETPRTPLAAVDTSYLVTRPGDRYYVHFATDRTDRADTTSYTYLVATHGYYTEWVRGQWIAENAAPERFVPGDGALLAALLKWRERKVEMERSFFETRIPVR
jgi:hypothetical protein